MEQNHSEKIRSIVKIAGKEYTISSYDPKAHVQRVADTVNRKMDEFAAGNRIPPQQLAVLVAVNSTDELIKVKDEVTFVRRENEALREEIERLKALLAAHEVDFNEA